jgi:hypothetical protein
MLLAQSFIELQGGLTKNQPAICHNQENRSIETTFIYMYTKILS